MTLWRKTRTETAGAWRSLNYDLGRRDGEPSDVGDRSPDGRDVTSTGMNTFGGVAESVAHHGDLGGYRRSPRRAVAVAAFGTLAVAGAAGSYFAVVNGLNALLTDRPATAGPYPLAIGDTTADQVSSNAGLGKGAGGPAAAAPVVAVPPAATAAGVPVTTTTQPAPRLPAVTRTAPARPGPQPTDACDCDSPPVPTPTSAPSTTSSTTPTPTDSGPASPDPTDSSAAPEPTDSASSAPSNDPSANSRRGHRRRH